MDPGLGDALAEIGVATAELGFFSKLGLEIWTEPRGKEPDTTGRNIRSTAVSYEASTGLDRASGATACKPAGARLGLAETQTVPPSTWNQQTVKRRKVERW